MFATYCLPRKLLLLDYCRICWLLRTWVEINDALYLYTKDFWESLFTLCPESGSPTLYFSFYLIGNLNTLQIDVWLLGCLITCIGAYFRQPEEESCPYFLDFNLHCHPWMQAVKKINSLSGPKLKRQNWSCSCWHSSNSIIIMMWLSWPLPPTGPLLTHNYLFLGFCQFSKLRVNSAPRLRRDNSAWLDCLAFVSLSG